MIKKKRRICQRAWIIEGGGRCERVAQIRKFGTNRKTGQKLNQKIIKNILIKALKK